MRVCAKRLRSTALITAFAHYANMQHRRSRRELSFGDYYPPSPKHHFRKAVKIASCLLEPRIGFGCELIGNDHARRE
jgi:hypothetical protein